MALCRCFKIAEKVVSIAKIAIRLSFAGPVAYLLCNNEV